MTDPGGKSGVYLSSSHDAAKNLALEESLMTRILPGVEILLMYENDPALVIGRFQNPWKECRTGMARRKGLPILRRISGGGTVVHGPGNLNFAVIRGSKSPDKTGNLDRVIRALGTLGLEIRRNKKYDLRMGFSPAEEGSPGDTDGFKVSGSAFRQTSCSSIHHATLLVKADIESLKLLLHQAPREMEARGVESIPSPVANLSDSIPSLDVDTVIRAMAAEWGMKDGPEVLDPDSLEDLNDTGFYAEARVRLESPEWIWGKTPFFRERFRSLPSLPARELILEVREGRVAGAPDYASFLLEVPYQGYQLSAAAGTGRPGWLEDLAARVDGDG